jgi:hypothetical protein
MNIKLSRNTGVSTSLADYTIWCSVNCRAFFRRVQHMSKVLENCPNSKSKSVDSHTAVVTVLFVLCYFIFRTRSAVHLFIGGTYLKFIPL